MDNEYEEETFSEEEDDNSTIIEPAIYGNNIHGNDWLKDYNTSYPIKINERSFPTLEHYYQYKRYCYTMGTENCEEFYNEIVSEKISSYYELINYAKEKIPRYKGSIKSLQGIYDLLYEDYIFARLTKALKYKEIRNYLKNMHNENIVPKQQENCNITSSSLEDEEKDFLKVTLMHIDCKSLKGSKIDPWITVTNVIVAQSDAV